VAGWDGSVRLIRLADGAERGRAALGTAERATAVAFTPDGGGVVAAGHLGTVKVWDAGLNPLREWRAHGLGVTGLALAGGRVATASVDRTVRVWDVGTGRRELELPGHERPLSALAFSRDGSWLASGAVDGQLVLWSTPRAARPPGQARPRRAGLGPRLQRRRRRAPLRRPTAWSAAGPSPTASASGPPPRRPWRRPPRPPEHARGAAAFRKCAACHTLEPDGGNRAGPTFHGLFGRRAGSVPGYAYSRALKESGIVWTEETVGRLFELGPDRFTPGSKMPMQQMPDRADREALIAYLRAVTVAGAR
jgi:cytochrome c